MIEALQDWVDLHRRGLAGRGIAVSISSPTQGPGKNGVHAELRSRGGEAIIQLWDSGEADFHVWNGDPTHAVVVWHHQFRSGAELDAALAELVDQFA